VKQAKSKIEVKGFEARYYDHLMNLITFFTYPKFIRDAIRYMNISKGEKIADFGAGTGRNAMLMRKYVGEDGFIIGVDIGEEMKEQFLKRASKYDNVFLFEQSIDEIMEARHFLVGQSLPERFKKYREGFLFDRVFISFVLHGFEQHQRILIIQNAYHILRDGGELDILDWNERDVDSSSWFTRLIFNKLECALAKDFVERNWSDILDSYGFKIIGEKLFYRGLVRLLRARKVEELNID